jgi:hypothetical protein
MVDLRCWGVGVGWLARQVAPGVHSEAVRLFHLGLIK